MLVVSPIGGERAVTNEESILRLSSDTRDYVASAAKSVLGAAPFVGSLLVELAGNVIPEQRIDRIAKFAEHLQQRLGALEQDSLRAHLHDENFTDLMEEGLQQAARAVSNERKAYIAALLVNSITSDDIGFIETKHILRLLGEINDIEVLWLRFFLVPTIGGDELFRERHKTILDPIPAYIGAPQEQLDQAALQKSYKEHLVQLGLLQHRYRTDNKTKMPEFDTSPRGGMKVAGYSLSPLGRLLLREIDLQEHPEDRN